MKASVVERSRRKDGSLKTCGKCLRSMETIDDRRTTAARRKVQRAKTSDDRKYKTVFDKGYTLNWTTEVFRIIKVQTTNPVTYLIEDSRGEPIAGGFYEHELHHVANPNIYLVEKVLRRKGAEVYVKWLGFDDSHNSWIHKDNVV
ncbi:uncharacterized protein LOC113561774 [Ooceraea biroi]|uniref:uncharacterized protein LOC113561774 n=1 Tax=Ooceraea biroi TaxID=2015173 RepID=UPI000F08CABF|nr:uncharacterized protein LOC113561774 [Ooceraea biroi]